MRDFDSYSAYLRANATRGAECRSPRLRGEVRSGQRLAAGGASSYGASIFCSVRLLTRTSYAALLSTWSSRGQPWTIPILRNHEPRDGSTCHRQSCANQHHYSESKHKCFPNRCFHGGFRFGIEADGRLHAGEFNLVGFDFRQNARLEREVSQAVIQVRAEGVHHHNPKDCNRKYAGDTSNRIVDSRSC